MHWQKFFLGLEFLPFNDSMCLLFVSSESGNATWEIAQVTLKDEGYYECIAISSAGTGRARTFLDVSGNHTNRDPKTP